ncbi:PBS lyase, partial [Streptomyces sp. NPDC005899]|uniref:PBS lyase n=1 Tax=Streptomyces sp. NPDC005899 TaxID=3155716 RepID=UPI0033E5382E
MFAGIDEVDWASMEHAYGPADDVPALLRGLASADAAERESALDGMYGAVHHQGDVYACTLASIPFLFELVGDPGVRDRGCLVELLTSIGGIDLDEDDEDDLDEDEIEGAANYAMAAAAVTAGADVFFELMTDEDPGVRLAAPLALATLHRHPVRVLALLRERLPVEADGEVRLALVEAAGRTALRHRPLAGQVADWLGRLAAEAYEPGLRLAALAQLARCSADALPGDVVRVVSALLRELRSGPAPVGPQQVEPVVERASSTLVGQVRALSAAESAERRTPWAADLLRTLHVGLDDRVEDRTALLADQLCSPDPWQRIDAVRMSGGLMRAWRGPYEGLVRLVGTQLTDPEPRLAEAASHVLEELFGLAAPAADALAERVCANPGAWVREWASGPPGLGSSVKALARLGDARVLPALAAALERPEIPHDAGFAIGHLGAMAAPLAGALRRRLGEVGLDEGAYDRASPLLCGLTALRAGEAVPEVLRVLRGAPDYRGEWLRTAALRALGSFGPAARRA